MKNIVFNYIIGNEIHKVLIPVDRKKFVQQCCKAIEKVINPPDKKIFYSKYEYEIDDDIWEINYDRTNKILLRLDDFNFTQHAEICEKVCQGKWYFRWSMYRVWIAFSQESDLVLFKLLK